MALGEHAVPRQRADAARNRERLLAAAGEMFRERGLDVGVGEIADRAGVGRGTLFRNFPTKQDLILAVVLERVDQALDRGRERLASAGEDEALFPFLTDLIGWQTVDRSLMEAVGEEVFLSDERMAAAHRAILELIDELIAHDQQRGFVRDGLGAMDMLLLIKGACAIVSSMPDLSSEALERHLSLVRGAIAAPGRQTPLVGTPLTVDDLHG